MLIFIVVTNRCSNNLASVDKYSPNLLEYPGIIATDIDQAAACILCRAPVFQNVAEVVADTAWDEMVNL
jgi:hypothetical protein